MSDWMKYSLCRTDGEFNPRFDAAGLVPQRGRPSLPNRAEVAARVQSLRATCAACPVLRQCTELAFRLPFEGVFIAGMLPNELRAAKRERAQRAS